MFDSGKVRLNRLFNSSGKCLDVATDHGIFNEGSFLDGLENVPKIITQLVDAGPDAIQMNYGQSDVLQKIPGKNKPALVMRIDAGNPYNPTTHQVMFDMLQDEKNPILGALRMDAACVICNLKCPYTARWNTVKGTQLLPRLNRTYKSRGATCTRRTNRCRRIVVKDHMLPVIASATDVLG